MTERFEATHTWVLDGERHELSSFSTPTRATFAKMLRAQADELDLPQEKKPAMRGLTNSGPPNA